MVMPWTLLINSVTGLISEAVEDPDKRNEINLKIQELEQEGNKALLAAETSPFVDALVKLLIAFKDVVIPLLRPLGAACMTGFGMYCHLKGISMETSMQLLMDGAFPAWGASRHVEKQKVIKQQQSEVRQTWD